MARAIPNHGNNNYQAINSGPVSRRLAKESTEKFENLFVKEKHELAEDAVYRDLGKKTEKRRLGENPHKLIIEQKYHRNGFQARTAIFESDDDREASNQAWQKSSKGKVKFDLDQKQKVANSVNLKTKPQPKVLEERVSKLEAKLAELEKGILENKFAYNPNVSFPESIAGKKQFQESNSNYQAHKKSYSSMIADLSNSSNRIGLA